MPPSRRSKPKKDFDSSRYHTRFIALKFAYLGQKYNGYEYHANNPTPLPTIEEELWKALTKTKLIFPSGPRDVDWQGCDYSKCGRTDRGVSAFGQVIGIRVRSNQKQPKHHDIVSGEEDVQAEERPFDPIDDEISYPRVLNRVLPDDIRVIAWCPSPPPGFSARFSCRERRYRYFFTQPAYTPRADAIGVRECRTGASRRDGWLNIAAMQEAAVLFVGAHDFRNFCKHDPARQITNFERNITYCSIEEASSSTGMPAFLDEQAYGAAPAEDAKVYTFTIYGSAFLWHQVRHMAAIIFLVGQGLEPPSIISELLDVGKNPTKPLYEMADDAPLVLWDCVFPGEEKGSRSRSRSRSPGKEEAPRQDSLHWIYSDGQPPEKGASKGVTTSNGRFGPGGIQEVLWAGWRRKKIDEVLAASLLDRVAKQGIELGTGNPDAMAVEGVPFGAVSTKVFDGGNAPRLKGEYTPIMQRERQENVEILNARYAERKGLPPKNSHNPIGSDVDE